MGVTSRPSEERDGTQCIMAGGGGAYFYPTHGLPGVGRVWSSVSEATIPSLDDPSGSSAAIRVKSVYPDPTTSAGMAWRSIQLLWLNPALAFLLVGPLYLLLNYILRTADPDTSITNAWAVWERAEKDEKKEPAAKPEKDKPFDLEQAIQPERERPESTPGALLRVSLDSEHWLSAGSDGEVSALVEGRRIFAPITLDKGRNVGVYAARDKLVAAGLVWDDAEALLAQRAFLIEQPLGDGRIVAFAEDPNYRGFSEATELLFMNAVLLGPALR